MRDKNLSDLTDAQLIAEYRDGNNRAFGQLVARYKDPLFTYLLRMVKDPKTAEDLFQETFLKVIKGIFNYDERGCFNNWLFGIAYRLIIDYSRKNGRKTEMFEAMENDKVDKNFNIQFQDMEAGPDQKTEQKQLRAMLDSAFQKLPFDQKQVFLLREHSGLTFQEIADLLDRPLNTVLAQMRYSLNNLKKILEKKYAGEIQDVLQ